MSKLANIAVNFLRSLKNFWRRNWLTKFALVIILLLLVFGLSLFGLVSYYKNSTKNKPLALGVSFIPYYAQSLGLDPQKTMDELININVKRFRLVSYWNVGEPSAGEYNFDDLDWQFKKAEQAKAKVSLAIGLRQPRWPECHMPKWAQNQPIEKWQPRLESYITKVVDRYKNSPSLESWQLENEYFNDFGDCPDYSRQRLISEFNLVKKHDTKHPVILSRSNNSPSLVLGKPMPDMVGVSIYRKVWDSKITHNYYDYPFPSWYYASFAGLQKLLTGRNSMIHEMQMEPWPPSGEPIKNVPKAEQDKSMNASEFDKRINFAKNTGMRTIDLWGAEWWYYRKVKLHDDSFWIAARQAFSD